MALSNPWLYLGDIPTVGASGNIPPPTDVPIYLLPLLEPKQSSTPNLKPPIDQLPNGKVSASRVVFEQTSSSSSSPVRWTSTTHVFPSAYPRSHYLSTAPPGPPQPYPDDSLLEVKDKSILKEVRERDMALLEERAAMMSFESFYAANSEIEAKRTAETLLLSGQPQLWSAIQRIVPSSSAKRKGQGITLFLAHANGFHKEIWEPMLLSLLESFEQQQKFYVEEIWSLDTFTSGESGLMNREHLSIAINWQDHARDMQQFLEFYLPLLDPSAPMPTALDRQAQRGAGRSNRRIVGVGHSHSASSMEIINAFDTTLFDGIAICDPITHWHTDWSTSPLPGLNPLAQGALAKRDLFVNREAVVEYMKGKSYFNSWDDRVRNLHIRYGLAPLSLFSDDPKQPSGNKDSDGDNVPLTWCTTKWNEALTFYHSYSSVTTSIALQQQLEQYAQQRPANGKERGPFIHCIFTSYFKHPMLANTGYYMKELFAKANPAQFTWEDVKADHLIVMHDPNLSGQMFGKAILGHLSRRESTREQGEGGKSVSKL